MHDIRRFRSPGRSDRLEQSLAASDFEKSIDLIVRETDRLPERELSQGVSSRRPVRRLNCLGCGLHELGHQRSRLESSPRYHEPTDRLYSLVA